jgi:hypothetical protein
MGVVRQRPIGTAGAGVGHVPADRGGRTSATDEGDTAGPVIGSAIRCARTRSIMSWAWAAVNSPSSTARTMAATVLWWGSAICSALAVFGIGSMCAMGSCPSVG